MIKCICRYLSTIYVAPTLGENFDNDDKCEYVALVEWIVAVNRDQAKWKSKTGIYTTPLVRASLNNQPKTIEFLEKEFGVNLRDLVQ